MPDPAFAWGRGHKLIRAWAVSQLPAWQKKLLAEGDWLRLQTDYTSLQDTHAGGNSPHLDKYCLPPARQSLHDVGPPEASLINLQWYLTQILEHLEKGESDEAMKFLGVLCHWNEDPGCPSAHSSPVDETTLRRLLPPTPEMQNKNYLFGYGGIADAGKYQLPEERYSPRLLGSTVPEAAARIYQHQRLVRSFAAARIVPLVQAVLAEEDDRADDIRREAALHSAKHVADILYTAFCLAGQRYDPDEVAALKTVRLTEWEPEIRHQMISHPYYVTPFLVNRSLDAGRKLHPLAFCEKDSEKDVAFGFGMGTPLTLRFVIGPGIVFERFTCRVGLHPNAGDNGQVAFAVLVNGEVAQQTEPLPSGSPPVGIDIALPDSPLITLELKTIPHPSSTGTHNLTVWGEPMLHRADH